MSLVVDRLEHLKKGSFMPFPVDPVFSDWNRRFRSNDVLTRDGSFLFSLETAAILRFTWDFALNLSFSSPKQYILLFEPLRMWCSDAPVLFLAPFLYTHQREYRKAIWLAYRLWLSDHRQAHRPTFGHLFPNYSLVCCPHLIAFVSLTLLHLSNPIRQCGGLARDRASQS